MNIFIFRPHCCFSERSPSAYHYIMSKLTDDLLSSSPDAFRRATQSAFLASAAAGELRKSILGTWLANDRLYIHSYITGVGKLLSILQLPQDVPKPGAADPSSVKLLDWLVAALVNIRREKNFFVDAAVTHGLPVCLETDNEGYVCDEVKLPALHRYEELFNSIQPGNGPIPWLEGAVLFYATEKAYLEAWTWTKNRLVQQDPTADADGGALRNEFIPNWTSPEFVAFVDQLGDIIDEAADEQRKAHGGDAKEHLLNRSLKIWDKVIAAEEGFWPEVRHGT